MKSFITVLLVLAPQLVFAVEEATQQEVVQEEAAQQKVAQEKTAQEEEGGGLKAIGAAIAIAVGALGGALGQGRLAAAAMEGIARNPQAGKTMFVPFMIGLGLIESLVIYCLIIAMRLSG